MKNEREMLKSGVILQEYGTKFVLSINDASAIDKVRWSIVPLGTGGKDALDFYMNIEDMRLLCSEILSGQAEEKIKADAASAYPSAYKYVTGENAVKSLAIGGGQKGVRIQQGNKDQKKNYMTVITMGALKTLAFKFNLVYGLIPATGYYGDLQKAFAEGAVDRQKYRIELSKDDVVVEEVIEMEPEEKKQQTNVPETKPEPAKAETTTEPTEEKKAERYVVAVTGEGKEYQVDDKTLLVYKGKVNGKTVQLAIPKEKADGLKWIPKFNEALKDGKAHELPVLGVLDGKVVYFESVG